MPDYTTLSSQIDLFKTKVTDLASTTLDANDLVLIASALDTLAKSMGVNDILAVTNERIAAITAAKDAAIVSINQSVNGTRLTDLETDSANYETRIYAVENYVNTAGGNISALSSLVTALDSSISPNVPRAWQTITASYQAVIRDRLLVVPAAGMIITLPVAPIAGDMITFIDAAGTAGTTNFTIARNGKPIQSLAEDLIVDVSSSSFDLVFYNNVTGWRIA
jgi:uncharacterized protein (UPF0210 family)